MKKIILILLLLVNYKLSFSQNLVPNPGFEFFDTCYYSSGAIYSGNAPPWDSPSDGSDDLFNGNNCSPLCGHCSEPLNNFGFQHPHTGVGYAGGGFYSGGTGASREYCQVELDSVLGAQKKYCVTFYVSLADEGKIGINNIGLYFSTAHVYIPTNNNLGFIPQINDTNIIGDTANWTLISGEYLALGGERYIIIGNFYTDTQTDTIHLNGTGPTYYYIDDVSVVDCTGSGLGVGDVEDENIKIYPNPALNNITIETKQIKGKLTITNVLGEEVYTTATKSTTLEIDVGDLPKGLYFVEVRTEKGILRKKFIKQ